MEDLKGLIERREDLRTILGVSLWTSVEVNGLFVRSTEIQSRLVKFGRNLVRYTHLTDYELQLIGSAAALRYRGQNFVVSTAHQLRNVDERDVGVVIAGENKYVSSAGFVRLEEKSTVRDDDGSDLVAFHFTEQVKVGTVPASHFFNLSADNVLGENSDVVAFLGFGCPFCDQKYHVADANHLGTAVRAITLEPDKDPADRTLGACRLIGEMDFDPNGLSGGPMFAVVMENAKLILKFAGIINRAGGGKVHFIKARMLLRLLGP